ncbi:hypothetical protein ABZW47_16255 [Streptomyces sp. NPDC004549]|uniref:hypothetical protein n=1 Tax=Streptomyces sp. NPDC004549 TaxID=3154283 RepID=UPI0033BEB357
MEGIWPSEEDNWEDDLDEEWFTEPLVTYREAVESLQNLVCGRTDVHIDWNGQRGPQHDARVVFTGAGGLRVRLRSAAQLDGFTRLLRAGILLPSHHAVWYPQEGVVRARLVGDYDQLYGTLVRKLALRQKRAADPDSPLGRDVGGLLSEAGAFPVRQTTVSAGEPARTMRLLTASQDLRLLYAPRRGGVLSLALELTGVSARDAAEAERELVDYGTSYLFGLGKATGASLRLWNSEYRLGSRKGQAYSGKVRFPRRRYAPHPAELYGAGNSEARDPVERYLKYYQVLEFYTPKAVALAVAAQSVATPGQATSPFPRPQTANRLASEQNALDAVIGTAVTTAQLAGLLRDGDLFATLSNPQVIQDVQVLQPDSSGGPRVGHDYRMDVSTRVYGIRNRIVHMKEGGGRKRERLLAPYSREARDLSADLRLVRFLAEYAMEHWSEVLP